ncbi:MAG: glycosyltransferase, partial [Cytophagales bacterium]|nr:glycosyltransferase [Cytophagales bacterium]
MPRKRIEVNLKLVGKLFENEDFIAKFRTNPQLKLSILVTGPIPLGQFQYFIKLLHSFSEFLNELKPRYRQRVFFGFLFSEFDKERFKKRFHQPIDIPELYNIASLILLPSETEGRGLPIIEATACGIPIFCRRYYPEKVYSEVIGEHLEEKDRLKVLDFDGTRIPDKLVDKVIDRVFFPQNYIGEVEHNIKVVQKRYSIQSLQTMLEDILYRLYLQLQPNEGSMRFTVRALNEYKKCVSFTNKDLEYIINTKNRHYLPGFGRLAFMLYLKSLIDPSYFRVEEQQIRGIAMVFAQKCISDSCSSTGYSERTAESEIGTLHQFYNCVDNIFHYYKGEVKIRHDHSFAYRHRNKKHYPYQDFTHHELTGLINMIYHQIISPSVRTTFKISPHFFTDWNLALFQLTNSSNLAIDDRKLLTKMLRENVPVAYFPGEYIKYELEFFVLQPIRSRLKLKIEEELTEGYLKKHYKNLSPVYIFCTDNPHGRWLSAEAVENYIADSSRVLGIDSDKVRTGNPANPIDTELNLLYKYGICKIVKTKQWCVGIHFPQLGHEALKILGKIKRQKGFIIANGDNAPVMTDIVDIDRFHIGKAEKELTSKILGIPLGSGFIQFVPAGIRTTLAYPTPVQTAKDFSQAIKSSLFNKLCKKIGREQVFNLLKKDAETKSTPINIFLEKFTNPPRIMREKVSKLAATGIDYSFVTGKYEDGLPWNGVIAKVDIKNQNWNFATFTGSGKTQLVTDFVKDFHKRFRKKIQIAWNGGYILNAELVGKLGLPESYIGSPLGLLITNEVVVCPPLYNKPAFIIYADGRLDICRVNCRNGIIISDGKHTIDFDKRSHNLILHSSPPVSLYYDLMYDEETIDGNGNVIVRLAGNKIKEVIHTQKGQKVKMIPVGLTLSIPKSLFPGNWDVGRNDIPVNKTLQIKSPPPTPSPPEKEKRGIGETERKKTKQFTDSPIHPFTDSV